MLEKIDLSVKVKKEKYKEAMEEMEIGRASCRDRVSAVV